MNADEMLAVVDDNDSVIDYRRRQDIHKQGLLHRAVHILVFNDQGWLFLQKRSVLKDINPGLWDSSAAGHVDAGEDYAGTALREIQEELGVRPDILNFLFKLPASPTTGMEFVCVYQCCHNGPFVLAEDEIETGTWFSTQQIDRHLQQDDLKLTDTFKAIWQRFRQNQCG